MSAPLDDVIARAQADPDFRARLLAEPATTLAAEGVELPEGADVVAVDVQPGQLVVVVPPLSDRISDDLLGDVVGASGIPTGLGWFTLVVNPQAAGGGGDPGPGGKGGGGVTPGPGGKG